MIIANVKFETELTDEQAMKIAKERLPLFLEVPGLIQKYYVKNSQPHVWTGVYIWDSMEALQNYRESDLAKSIPAAYKAKGAPQIEVNNVPMALRG
ncbi:MAG: YdhR family protein [Gammaproteobacteria bacterium]|nr:YdhR family protein [Gammaproteobacteria bacterium]